MAKRIQFRDYHLVPLWLQVCALRDYHATRFEPQLHGIHRSQCRLFCFRNGGRYSCRWTLLLRRRQFNRCFGWYVCFLFSFWRFNTSILKLQLACLSLPKSIWVSFAFDLVHTWKKKTHNRMFHPTPTKRQIGKWHGELRQVGRHRWYIQHGFYDGISLQWHPRYRCKHRRSKLSLLFFTFLPSFAPLLCLKSKAQTYFENYVGQSKTQVKNSLLPLFLSLSLSLSLLFLFY